MTKKNNFGAFLRTCYLLCFGTMLNFLVTLGISTILGGQSASWGEGLASGFGSFTIAALLMSLAFLGLILCLCEIVSALPFVGCSFSLVRCSLGFYQGFLVGCLNFTQNIVLSSIFVLYSSKIVCEILNIDSRFELVFWFIFYASFIAYFHFNARSFAQSLLVPFCILSLIFAAYVLGCLKWVDLPKYAPNMTSSHVWFVGGISKFMESFKFAGWFFVGIENLALTQDEIDNPKIILPVYLYRTFVLSFSSFVLLYFVTSSLPPGVFSLVDEQVAITRGFELILGSSASVARLVALPFFFISGCCHLYPCIKVLRAMSDAHLFSVFFKNIVAGNNSSLFASFLSVSLGYIVCLVSFFLPIFRGQLFSIAILCAFINYIAQIVSYVLLKSFHHKVESARLSPLGVPGAIFSLLLFALGTVSVVGFGRDCFLPALVVIGISVIFSIYYFFYGRYRQIFTGDEQRILFKVQLDEEATLEGKTARKKRRDMIVHRVATGLERGLTMKSFWSSSNASIAHDTIINRNISSDGVDPKENQAPSIPEEP